MTSLSPGSIDRRRVRNCEFAGGVAYGYIGEQARQGILGAQEQGPVSGRSPWQIRAHSLFMLIGEVRTPLAGYLPGGRVSLILTITLTSFPRHIINLETAATSFDVADVLT
jgi:hypothetical protein